MRQVRCLALVVIVLLPLGAVARGVEAAVPSASARGARASRDGSRRTLASWYGTFHHGRRTASGERYNMWAMTAAHPTLPFGTRVLVTNLHNGRSVTVRINDRGPHHHGRGIDLSYAAARAIGAVGSGVVPVRLTPVDELPVQASAEGEAETPERVVGN